MLSCTLEDVELVEKWHSAISFCSKFTSWCWDSRCTMKLQTCMRFISIICREWRNHRTFSSLTLIRIQEWVYEMWRIQIWFYSRLSGTWGEVGLRPPYPPYQVSLERSHVVMANYSNWFVDCTCSLLTNLYAFPFCTHSSTGKRKRSEEGTNATHETTRISLETLR